MAIKVFLFSKETAAFEEIIDFINEINKAIKSTKIKKRKNFGASGDLLGNSITLLFILEIRYNDKRLLNNILLIIIIIIIINNFKFIL